MKIFTFPLVCLLLIAISCNSNKKVIQESRSVIIELQDQINFKQILVDFPNYHYIDAKLINKTANQWLVDVLIKDGSIIQEFLKVLEIKDYVTDAYLSDTTTSRSTQGTSTGHNKVTPIIKNNN